MASHQPLQETGDRLRLIAAASVAALAVVLPLAAATAGPHGDGVHRGNAGHSASHHASGTDSSDGD
ncbi:MULTISPECIES: hypothetical protein [unclassified Streptomyces]|uniref:hypothetical protein n=1 Tax=unclassified Streptomyces TaxID=2593676 RepID=UPI002E36B920|nr:hypothetical protein [Streptomyces sp. NBC_01477]